MLAKKQEQQLNRFPDHLWRWVEQLLIKHLDVRSGSFYGGGGTDLRDQCSPFTISKKCGLCRDGKVFSNGIALDCTTCMGTGELLYPYPQVDSATRPCPYCTTHRAWARGKGWAGGSSWGSGRHHPRNKRWPGIRADELAWCVECQGRGYVDCVLAAKVRADDNAA